MINIYVPAPRRWQPGYDEPRPCQGLLQPLFLLSNITQYDLTALQLLQNTHSQIGAHATVPHAATAAQCLQVVI